jgi:hypothetical protein
MLLPNSALVERRPRHPVGNQMHLEGAHVLQVEVLRRTAEEADLGSRSLGRRA